MPVPGIALWGCRQIATVVPAVQSHAKSSIALLAAVVNAGTLTGQDQYV